MQEQRQAYHIVNPIIVLLLLAGCGKPDASTGANSSMPTTAVLQERTSTERANQIGNTGQKRVPGNDSKGRKPPNAADEAAVRGTFKRLSALMRKKDYAAASSLMTPAAFDGMLVRRFMQAIVSSSGIGPTPARKLPILKHYQLDSIPMTALIGRPHKKTDDAVHDRTLDELHKKVLAKFKTHDEKLQALARLDREEAASKPAGEMNMVELDFFGGEVVGVFVLDDTVVLEVRPKLLFPGGAPPMRGDKGHRPAPPEGAELPGGLPGGLPSPDGGPAGRAMGEIPSFYLKFRKQGDSWKWDGLDEERMAKEFGAADPLLDHPIIENPQFKGKSLSGKTVDLKEYRGKLVLVDFWGTWCKPCVEELPKLKRIYEVLRPHGFEIIGIAEDNESTLKSFFGNRPPPWENIVDGQSGTIAKNYNVNAFPTTLLIDQKGNHVASNLHGGALVDELAKRLNLDPETKRQLWTAILTGNPDDRHTTSGTSEPDNAPGFVNPQPEHLPLNNNPGLAPNGPLPPRLPAGFGIADANGDKKVSENELRSYLAARLVGLNVPYNKVFARLDGDSNHLLDESEFSRRHAAIRHFVPAVVFGPDSMPPDPGKDFKFFVSRRHPIDDRGIFGAVLQRSQETAPFDMHVRLDDIPQSHTGTIPKATQSVRSVERLIQATVILSENTGGVFTGGAVVVSKDGLAVTNYHIAALLSRGGLVGFTSDGKTHRVIEFLAGNRERDVALIRLEGNDFVSVPIATSMPGMGDDIVMLHHTENRFYTYDRGYVMRYPKVGRHPWMEISADYGPGGSGCGIFNSKHELVGLVSMIEFGDGPTLAQGVLGNEIHDHPGPGAAQGNTPRFDQTGLTGPNRVMLRVKHAAPLPAVRGLWGGE